jgi:tryptophan-rich sensory protein
MENYTQYREYKKPTWAPPSWLFGPVWTFLYILIFISFGYVFYKWYTESLSFTTILPFILNLIFNFIFTPIQFRLKNFLLAAIDVVLVWITLVWAMVSIYPIFTWVTYISIPYLLWVTFASVLQITVTIKNR